MPTNAIDVSVTDNFTLPDEYHVASFVAYPIATQIEEVKEAIMALTGAEIHVTSPEGKIVFTLEGKSQRMIGNQIDELKSHTGLINLSPVYQQYIDETKN